MPTVPLKSFIVKWSKPGCCVILGCYITLVFLSLEEFHSSSLTLPTLIFLNLWQLFVEYPSSWICLFPHNEIQDGYTHTLAEKSPRLSIRTVSCQVTQCQLVLSLVTTLITCWRSWLGSAKSPSPLLRLHKYPLCH